MDYMKSGKRHAVSTRPITSSPLTVREVGDILVAESTRIFREMQGYQVCSFAGWIVSHAKPAFGRKLSEAASAIEGRSPGEARAVLLALRSPWSNERRWIDTLLAEIDERRLL